MKSVKTRKLPDGVYIRGSVHGYPILFIADTGASKTIVYSRFYDSMCSEDKPGPKVIKLFSSSAQLSMKFQLLINVEIIKISGKFRFKTQKLAIYPADKC